jgi:predicted NACHT family NTPase
VLNRNEQNPMPAHDYDIVEGPVADDKVQNRIEDYLTGEITKTDFLEELKWHEETHQICFCTVASLQFLQQTDRSKLVSKFLHIGEPIVEKLVTDFGFDEKIATDKFFSSDTFSRLADTSIQFYKKDWTEVYKLLLNELKL